MEILSKRASAVAGENELSLVISASADKRKNNMLLLWLLLWTACGGVIIYSYFGISDQKAKIMTLVWIAFWVYFELLIMKAWRWKQFGREILKIKDGELRYKKDTSGRGWILKYPVNEITGLNVLQDKTPKWMKNLGEGYWNSGSEMLQLTITEERDLRFGFQLTPEEIKAISKLLAKYLRVKPGK